MNCTVTLKNPDGSVLFETTFPVSRTLTKEEFDSLVRQGFIAFSYGTPTESTMTTTENIKHKKGK